MQIMIISEENGFIATSLLEHLQQIGCQVEMVDFSIQAISEYNKAETDAVILYLKEMDNSSNKLVYLKDYLEDKGLPVFVIYAGDWTTLSTPLPGVVKSFQRPIMVTDIAEQVKEYLMTHDRNEKKKILVVDDSGIMLRSMKEWLSDKYQVALVNSGAMAMKYLALHKPDLIVLDYEMPVVNGAQVLGMIRTEQEFEDIPVIFLTGKNDRATVMEVQQYRIQGYILKSEEKDKIVAQIDHFFENQNKG